MARTQRSHVRAGEVGELIFSPERPDSTMAKGDQERVIPIFVGCGRGKVGSDRRGSRPVIVQVDRESRKLPRSSVPSDLEDQADPAGCPPSKCTVLPSANAAFRRRYQAAAVCPDRPSMMICTRSTGRLAGELDLGRHNVYRPPLRPRIAGGRPTRGRCAPGEEWDHVDVVADEVHDAVDRGGERYLASASTAGRR